MLFKNVSRCGRLLLVLSLVCLPVLAQQNARDRYKFIDPAAPVSDDPRRVPVPPGRGGSHGNIVLRGGRVFDGTGSPAREGTVVIQGNRIAAILPPGSTDWPANARVIDVTGRTVMPGLIDLHTHLTYPDPNLPPPIVTSSSDAALRGVERLRYFIESGITTVRDVGSEGDVPFRLQAWVTANRVVGPRIFAAGQLITGTGGHGAETLSPSDFAYGTVREASGPDEWRGLVREQFKRGADLIKIASHFSKAEVAAAVQEAHALGLKVTCDCETFYIDWAVEAGIDMIEHPLPRSENAIALMAKNKTAAVPTLVPYLIILNTQGGYFGSTSRRFTFSESANLELVRKMKQAGIQLGVGTDLVSDWFRYLPQPYIVELMQFVLLGYTIPEALVTATRTNAELLDMSDKLGTLESGKLADVLVVEGRPDFNLDDLTRVDLVIRDGYIQIEHGQVSIPRHVPLPMPSKKKEVGSSKF